MSNLANLTLPSRAFGPDRTVCRLADCVSCTTYGPLCSFWLRAQNAKYSSALVWHIAEPEPNLFILYNHKREVVLMTNDWPEVLAHYRDRPEYVPKPPKFAKVRITL